MLFVIVYLFTQPKLHEQCNNISCIIIIIISDIESLLRYSGSQAAICWSSKEA